MCFIFYYAAWSAEKGSFNNLVLSKYKSKNFTRIDMLYDKDSEPFQARCQDKNRIDEFTSYLETLKLAEAKPITVIDDSYYIIIRNESKNSDGYLHEYESLNITVFASNPDFIEVFYNHKTKIYKITNGKFDMKYIQDIIKTGQVQI